MDTLHLHALYIAVPLSEIISDLLTTIYPSNIYHSTQCIHTQQMFVESQNTIARDTCRQVPCFDFPYPKEYCQVVLNFAYNYEICLHIKHVRYFSSIESSF